MPVGREQRRSARRTKVAVLFADRTDRALDLLELLDMSWHDTYGEVTPSDDIVDDVLLLSEGNLRSLIRWARLAIIDWRDVRVQADEMRARDSDDSIGS